jgi:hypothetical protein
LRIKLNIKISKTVLESARDDKFGVNRNLTKDVILVGELEAILSFDEQKYKKSGRNFELFKMVKKYLAKTVKNETYGDLLFFLFYLIYKFIN